METFDIVPARRASDVPSPVVATAATLIALLLLGGSAALAVLDLGLTWGIAGYLVGSVAPFTLVVIARRADLQRRAELGEVQPAWRRGVQTVVLPLGLVAAMVNAWHVAWEIARRVEL